MNDPEKRRGSSKRKPGTEKQGLASSENQSIPVVEETLKVDKRNVTTGKVKITKRVHKQVKEVDEPGYREKIHVERVPVNRPIEEPLPIRQEGDTTIIPVFEEVLVIEKRLMLKEELHITRERSEIRKPKKVTLRSEEAIIEHIDSHPRRSNGGKKK